MIDAQAPPNNGELRHNASDILKVIREAQPSDIEECLLQRYSLVWDSLTDVDSKEEGDVSFRLDLWESLVSEGIVGLLMTSLTSLVSKFSFVEWWVFSD